MYSICVDIGGTGMKAGIVSENGQIIHRANCKTDTESGFDKIISDINNLVRDLIDDNQINKNEIKSIGFGVPSFINNQVAALAESKFGSMNGKDISVLITLGTGLGGGIIINGKPFTGNHGMASEIGHVVIGENTYNCNCGNNGCFETFCSATALIKHTQERLKELKNTKEENRSMIINMCKGNFNEIDAKMVFDAYRMEDNLAKEVVSRFKHYLSIGIAGVVNTLDPGIISIGGGLSKSSDIILEGLKDMVREHILYKKENFADIKVATLGNDAGIIGAAFLNK